MSARQTVESEQAPGLFQQRAFRMLSFSRLSSNVAQNALNFALVLLIVDETGLAFMSSLLILALVVPSTVSGIIAGTAADVLPRRPLMVLGNLARCAVCVLFVQNGGGVLSFYVVAMAFAAAGPFAGSAAAALQPAIVERSERARANAISQAVGGAAQVLGLGVLTPVVLRLLDSPEALFLICAGLFFLSAVQAVLIGRVRNVSRAEVGGEPQGRWWLAGWRAIRGDTRTWHASVELTLISASLIILGGLIPSYISDVLGLPVDIGALILMPAAAGVVLGLRVASFLAHRVPHALLSSAGFAAFVVLLAGLTFVEQEASFLGGYGAFSWINEVSVGNFDRAGVLAMGLMLPLGFAFATVSVAGQTVLNDRVPLHLQGRVLATQAAMAGLASSVPVVLAGLLADLAGVTTVMALLAGGIGIAAVMNFRQPHTTPSPAAGVVN